MKAVHFPCLHPLHSADHTCGGTQTHVAQRHTCNVNKEQVLLSCDVTTKVLLKWEMRFKKSSFKSRSPLSWILQSSLKKTNKQTNKKQKPRTKQKEENIQIWPKFAYLWISLPPHSLPLCHLLFFLIFFLVYQTLQNNHKELHIVKATATKPSFTTFKQKYTVFPLINAPGACMQFSGEAFIRNTKNIVLKTPQTL